ncbi:MAG: VanW family protein [Angelakisella sp.]|jgi:vancomycin resistance protein VanW|nr:VanW family protein [Angelakisella sp.]
MTRKRLTERFPALLPLRQAQRKACFYLGMRLDGRRYAGTLSRPLPLVIFGETVPLYNRETGFPMLYQENKVFNLQLAAQKLNGLLIRPGETFSFFQAVREADREIPYRDGLIVVNGQLTTAPGGGLCQLSNLLFWLFLHSPLTIVERSGHREKDFPDLGDQPAGVDATVAEGWLDLKVRNDTGETYQLGLSFGPETMTGLLRADRETGVEYQVENRGLRYHRRGGEVIEEVDVLRRELSRATGELLRECFLYHNRCRIGYPLPGEMAAAE